LYGFRCELLFFKHLRIRIVWSWDGVQSFRSISSTSHAGSPRQEKKSQRQVAFSFCLRPQGQAVRGQDWSSEYIGDLILLSPVSCAINSFGS
jgi:hypothetical protein